MKSIEFVRLSKSSGFFFLLGLLEIVGIFSIAWDLEVQQSFDTDTVLLRTNGAKESSGPILP
jgi:hypothetical protein